MVKNISRQETVVDNPRSGWPRKTSTWQDRDIINTSKLHRTASLPDIATEMVENCVFRLVGTTSTIPDA